jgi:hypothetical protein
MLGKEQSNSNKEVIEPILADNPRGLRGPHWGAIFFVLFVMDIISRYTLDDIDIDRLDILLAFFNLLVLSFYTLVVLTCKVRSDVTEPLPPRGRLGNAILTWILCLGIHISNLRIWDPRNVPVSLFELFDWRFQSGIVYATVLTCVSYVLRFRERASKSDSRITLT